MMNIEKNCQNIKISVILPVFNVEGYIDACIASLKAQTLREMEFIFVDDCGTDASMRFVESFSAEDSRVRIIRNPRNLGPGPSRNSGIEAARGEYLSFVDPDDWLSADFFESLYQKAIDTQADIIKGTRVKVENFNNSQKSLRTIPSEKNSHVNKCIQKSQRHKVPLFCVFTYEHQSAIYHRRLFDDSSVCYGTTLNAEDTTFLLRTCLKRPSISIDNSAVYYYVQRKTSSTGSFSKNRAFEELCSFQEKVNVVQELNEQLFKDEYILLYLTRMLSGYFANACVARYQCQFDKDDVVRYEQIIKGLMHQVEQKCLHNSELYSQAVELCAIKEYGLWIPAVGRKSTVPYKEMLQAWTRLFTEQPNARQIYIWGYSKALIRALAGVIVPNKAEDKISLKSICQQLKQLGVNQRQVIIRALPQSMFLILRKRISNSLYGFSK